jgi:TonB family protein
MANAPTPKLRSRPPSRGAGAIFGWSTGASVGVHLTVLAAAAWLTLSSGEGSQGPIAAIGFVASAETPEWTSEREIDRELELSDEVEPRLVEMADVEPTLLEDPLPERVTYSAPLDDSHAIAMQLALRWGQGRPAPGSAGGDASATPVAAAQPASPVAAAAPAREPVLVAAKLVKSEDPEYPRVSRRLDEQGTLTVRIHVGADGSVGDVELLESSGYERLDRSALDAIAKWRFEPATRDGVAIPWKLDHRVTFALHGATR